MGYTHGTENPLQVSTFVRFSNSISYKPISGLSEITENLNLKPGNCEVVLKWKHSNSVTQLELEYNLHIYTDKKQATSNLLNNVVGIYIIA